jgi:hypothetical protein
VQVWILAGGDGDERHQALAAAAHAQAMLSRYDDLHVDVFLLPPPGAGLNTNKRRL